MKCTHCESQDSVKRGKDRKGQQRYRCNTCRKTFIEAHALTGKHTTMDEAVKVLAMLLEGMSVRSVERLTGICKRTILAIMVQAGENCKRMLDAKLKDVCVDDVQADEIWSFVGCKEKTRVAKNRGEDTGDCYTFYGIERTTKLVVAWHAGKRSVDDTYTFASKLKQATTGHYQLTTDGYPGYKTAIPATFGNKISFAQLVKTYGTEGVEEQRRYSPAVVTGIEYNPIMGQPSFTDACTSHIERANLSLRMSSRRFTRLTNAFSKKWANHDAMLALWFAFYNFCRKHMTIKTTPAVEAGLTNETWSLARLLKEAALAC